MNPNTHFRFQGKLLLGGAFDPPTGAAIVFKATKEEVEAFVKDDPYVQNGLVTGWKVGRNDFA